MTTIGSKVFCFSRKKLGTIERCGVLGSDMNIVVRFEDGCKHMFRKDSSDLDHTVISFLQELERTGASQQELCKFADGWYRVDPGHRRVWIKGLEAGKTNEKVLRHFLASIKVHMGMD
jgi:hypothetical protein